MISLRKFCVVFVASHIYNWQATNDYCLYYLFPCLNIFFFPPFFSCHSWLKLFDRISSQVMSPSRAPPGDAINRCRDAVDSIQSATSHKYSRDKAELVHLLGSPHIQVSAIFYICQRALLLRVCIYFLTVTKSDKMNW